MINLQYAPLEQNRKTVCCVKKFKENKVGNIKRYLKSIEDLKFPLKDQKRINIV